MKARVARVLAVATAALFLLMAAGVGVAAADLNPLDNLMDQLCHPKDPPTPQPPMYALGLVKGVPESEHGYMARYGYGGLFWTTYDKGCLSLDRIDTAAGASVNDLANGGDTMINQLQAMALDPHTEAPLDGMLDQAVTGIKNALWNPWLAVPLVAVGLVAGVAAASGRVTDLGLIVANALIVLVGVTWLTSHPATIAHTSDKLTSNVAQQTSGALITATGGSAGPRSQAINEGYYRISYQAWLEGAFCGDKAAEAKFGPRLLDSQVYSVSEWDQSVAKMKAITEAKNAEWTQVAKDLAADYPAAYACWSGSGSSRMGAAIRHIVVTVCAGIPVAILSMLVLVLKNMLRFGLVIVAGVGLMMLFARRVTSAMLEFLLSAVVGSAMFAGVAGVLLFVYYAILSDPKTAWWTAVMSSIAFGIGVLASWRFIKKISSGGDTGAAGSTYRRYHNRSAGRIRSMGRGAAAPDRRPDDDPTPAPSPDEHRRPDPAAKPGTKPGKPAPDQGRPTRPPPARVPIPALVGAGEREAGAEPGAAGRRRRVMAEDGPPAEDARERPEGLPEHVRRQANDALEHWRSEARRKGTPPTERARYRPPPVER